VLCLHLAKNGRAGQPLMTGSTKHGMTTGISIIVCCYNSIKRLPVTLQALQRLEIPKGWDIELV
jgi:hypothetical protein